MSFFEPYAPLTTNEIVREVKALLHQCYQAPAYAELKRLLHEPGFPIIKSYINLAIVKEHEQKPKEDEQLKVIKTLSREEYINSFEAIYQPKQPIKIEDLLLAHGDEKKVLKRQLIEGRAGIGKTTLCQYLAHLWAAGDGKWQNWRQQFDWVIHLSLRQLTAEDQYDFSKLTIVSWFFSQYVTSRNRQHITEAELGVVFDALNAQGKVLLLLDGYDEIVPVLKTHLSFRQFFEQELLSCSYWFIFSRPYYFTDNRVERRLENIGFTQADILKYVQQYFRDVEEERLTSQQGYASSLIAFLKQNPNAMGIAHIPINLELLCYTWESEAHPLNNQLTLTQLYDHLVLRLFGRYLHKYYPETFPMASAIKWIQLEKDTKYYCNHMLAFLEQLAWYQMQRTSLIIQAEFIKDLVGDLYPKLDQASQRERFGEEVLKQLGLLKGCDTHKPTLEQSYYFIHLTFQEYFAARYWVKLFQSEPTQAEAIQILRDNKFNTRYESVWWMVAGLLKENRFHVESFFDFLIQTPQDLAGLNQQLIQMRCLEECQLDLSDNKKTQLLSGLGQWINYQLEKGEEYNFTFIATYLGMSPKVTQHAKIKQVFAACLKDKRKLVRLSILAEQLMLPVEVNLQLVELLRDSKWRVRDTADRALNAQPSLSEKVLVQLVELSKDLNKDVRMVASGVLDNQASLPESVCVQLVELLRDPKKNVRRFAAEALGGQTSLPESVWMQLVELLRDAKRYVKAAAAEALVRQASLPKCACMQLAAFLKDPNKYVRGSAALILGGQKSLPESMCMQLVDLLKDSNETVRKAAVNTLGDQPSFPKSVFVQLVAFLGDPNETVREAAAYVLSSQKSLSENMCMHLVDLLKDSNETVTKAAVDTLGDQPSFSKNVFVQLVAFLSDPNETVREAAAYVLDSQKSLSESMCMQLVTFLSHPNWQVSKAAARSLSRQPSLPKKVCVQLVALLRDPLNWRVIGAAARALDRQTSLPKSVCVQLVELLRDSKWRVRDTAARALNAQLSLSEKVLVQLVELLKDINKDVRMAASGVLDDQASLPESVCVQLVELLKNPNEEFRVVTARALGGQKSLPKSMCMQLMASLSDSNWKVREAVAYALGNYQSLPKRMCVQLMALLRDPKEYVSGAAAYALGRQLSLPESVCAQLVVLLRDPIERLRMAFAYALGVQQTLPVNILINLGSFDLIYEGLTFYAIEKLLIEYLPAIISAHLFSANLIPVLRLLLIKSHQQKLPIYFVDNKQASEKLPLHDGESKLHIGHVWQGTFTDQQKQLFVKAFNYVFLEMTGILPELSFTELQAFKNQLAGQMLSQARTLFQLNLEPFHMEFIEYKKILSRILFFTPAGQVLDSLQQEKIIVYAENRKTLHKPSDKFSFWQCMGIRNNQTPANVFNTFS